MTDKQKRTSTRPEKPVWFYEFRDQPLGPVDELALRRAAREGDLTRSTLVWRKSLDGWHPAAAVPQVLAIIEQEEHAARIASESRAPGPKSDAAAVQTEVPSSETSDHPRATPTSSHSASVPTHPSSSAGPTAAALPSSTSSGPSGADASSVEALTDGSSAARPSDASAGKGRSRPPLKPRASEVADDHGLADAVSEEEELERPIRQADVLELLERTRSSHPARGPVSLPSPESRAAPRPRGSSVPPPGASRSAPALERVDTGPAPSPPHSLPLWAKAIGVAALFLLGMGAVLLTGRPRGAAETADAEPTGRSTSTESSDAATAPTKVDAARPSSAPGASDRATLPVSARAAGPVEPDSAPAVVITEGPLPPGVFQKQLDAAAPMFDEQCWQRVRATEGEVAERPSISIELGVSAWGQLEKLVAGEAPAGYRGVGRCIVGRIRGWKFPRAKARTLVTLRIRASFDQK